MKFPVFQLAPIASYLFTKYHQGGSGITPPTGCLRALIRHLSLLLSRVSNPTPSPSPWCARCSNPFITLLALHGTCSNISMYLLHWGNPEMDK